MGTDAWGIDDGWWSNDGHWHDAPSETVAALRSAMGGADGDAPPAGPPLWFVDAGSSPHLHGPATVELEDGADLDVAGALPPDLPLGAHLLHPHDGGPTTHLFVTPTAVPRSGERQWGAIVQLYAARSRRSWGIGDLTDLRTVGTWLGRVGGSVLGVNPLGDVLPTTPRQASPYSPSSRAHLDPLWIDPDRLGVDLAPRPANRPLVDRDEVWRAKRAALLVAYEAAGAPPAPPGDLHAAFCALAELHGGGWPTWPAPLHDPRGDAVTRFAAEHPAAVGFWSWLDRVADDQFAAARDDLASHGVTLLGDLTVGVDPAGFDAWCHQDVLALGVGVGAPPDTFNPAGQNWGLPPFDPWALRAAAYRPFLDLLAAAFRRAGGLRIDHVMGLFRLFWIPPGAGPEHGTYVRYRADELLRLIVLEAVRAGAFVVGEDLGTVEDGVREHLAARGIAGTKVGWFDADPSTWSASSLGTLTTHDLPTVLGALGGTDPAADPAMAAQLLDTLGVSTTRPTPNSEAPGRDLGLTLQSSGWGAAATDPEDPEELEDLEELEELSVAAHAALARAGSDLVLATCEDLLGAVARPNQPGQVPGYPSWCVPLPVPIDDLPTHPLATRITSAMVDARPRAQGNPPASRSSGARCDGPSPPPSS